jgi:hypothetical protein
MGIKLEDVIEIAKRYTEEHYKGFNKNIQLCLDIRNGKQKINSIETIYAIGEFDHDMSIIASIAYNNLYDRKSELEIFDYYADKKYGDICYGHEKIRTSYIILKLILDNNITDAIILIKKMCTDICHILNVYDDYKLKLFKAKEEYNRIEGGISNAKS